MAVELIYQRERRDHTVPGSGLVGHDPEPAELEADDVHPLPDLEDPRVAGRLPAVPRKCPALQAGGLDQERGLPVE
jgi:hypothetical protein